MPPLRTARLFVRPFAAGDLDACVALFGIDGADAAALDRKRRFLQWAELNHVVLDELGQPPYGDRAVVLAATGELVGAVGLVPAMGPFARLPSLGGDIAADRLTPEVGLYWAVAPTHRRQGIATEAAAALVRHAFDELRLARLVATTETVNVASIGVMRRLGMRIEANPLPEPAWFQAVGVLEA